MQEDIFELVVDARKRGLPSALATVVGTKGSTPAKLSARMLIHIDGRIAGTIGGGCVEADVIRTARDVIDTGRARLMQFRLAGAEAERTGVACGGILDIMIESLEDSRTVIVGAGHVGQTTARLAAHVGLKVTVLDDRPDFANQERFPTADTIQICDLNRLPTDLGLTPKTSILIMTRGHSEDYGVLKWALTTPCRHIGVLGSRSKRHQFEASLSKEGFSQAEWSRVQMPLGISIGAESVEEIAVSIVAQLIQWRRQGEGTLAK